MNFRQKVYAEYLALIQEKIAELRQTLDDLKESSSNETKSTAGDKHETALAMLQIEQKNTSQQLKEALDKKILFEQLNLNPSTTAIDRGSLVKTSRGYLFVSLALGKIVFDGITILAISPQSPIGQKLLGLQVNGSATVNGLEYIIESIY